MARSGKAAVKDETNPRLEAVEAARSAVDDAAARYRASRERDLTFVPGDVLNPEDGWRYAAHEVYPDAQGPALGLIENTRERWHNRGYEFVTGPVAIPAKYTRAPGDRKERYPRNQFMEIWRVHEDVAKLHQADLDADFERAMAVFLQGVMHDARGSKLGKL